MNDLSKLPKWARDRIEQLTRNAEYWKAKATAGPEDSNTFLDTVIDIERPLGLDPHITFRFGDQEEIRAVFKTEGGQRWVEIMAFDGSVHIEPRLANVVYVRVARS